MLEKIRLHDWKNHEGLEIEFDTYVTCLVGDTDAGKTSVLQALRFAALNDIQAKIRNSESRTVVELHVDGHVVWREKSRKADNFYRLDMLQFDALGRNGVPKDIADLLRMGEVNFGSQHDLPFWFGLSSPEVSRQLNAIVNLSSMDDALASAAAEVKARRATADVCAARLEAARAARSDLDWVLEVSEQLDTMDGIEEDLQSLIERRVSLSSVLERAEAAQEIIRTADGFAQDLGEVLQVGERLLDVQKRSVGLLALVDKAQTAEQIASRSVITAEDLEQVDQLREDWEEVSQKRRVLSGLIARHAELGVVIHDSGQEHSKAQAELAEVEQCPLCGSQL